GPHLCMGAAMGRRHLGQFLQAAAARWPAIRLAFEAHARRDLLVRCFDRLVLLPPVHRSARHRRRAVPLADRRRRLRGSALAAPLRRFTPTAGTPASESGSSTS
ncbi:MAG TPA: hypothetical protein VMD59_19535, partial [Acidimicrobiales bacterium]|nr:hypothetical protein [Acidimicrobiales bacterium]